MERFNREDLEDDDDDNEDEGDEEVDLANLLFGIPRRASVPRQSPETAQEPEQNEGEVVEVLGERMWASTRRQPPDSDHSFSGILFDVQCKTDLPVEYITILEVAVGGELGDIAIFSCEGTYVGKESKPKFWTKVAGGNYPASQEARGIPLRTPVRIARGSSVGLYVHSGVPEDTGIFYNNGSVVRTGDRQERRPTFQDQFLTIANGMGHLGTTPFDPVGWGWGSWRDHRDFTGKLLYAVKYCTWQPRRDMHERFPKAFQNLVFLLCLIHRRRESILHVLPKELVFAILEFLPYDAMVTCSSSSSSSSSSSTSAISNFFGSIGSLFRRQRSESPAERDDGDRDRSRSRSHSGSEDKSRSRSRSRSRSSGSSQLATARAAGRAALAAIAASVVGRVRNLREIEAEVDAMNAHAAYNVSSLSSPPRPSSPPLSPGPASPPSPPSSHSSQSSGPTRTTLRGARRGRGNRVWVRVGNSGFRLPPPSVPSGPGGGAGYASGANVPRAETEMGEADPRTEPGTEASPGTEGTEGAEARAVPGSTAPGPRSPPGTTIARRRTWFTSRGWRS